MNDFLNSNEWYWLLAALLCAALLPIVLPFLVVERLGGARRGFADKRELPRAR